MDQPSVGAKTLADETPFNQNLVLGAFDRFEGMFGIDVNQYSYRIYPANSNLPPEYNRIFLLHRSGWGFCLDYIQADAEGHLITFQWHHIRPNDK